MTVGSTDPEEMNFKVLGVKIGNFTRNFIFHFFTGKLSTLEAILIQNFL